jgi:ATP-dependent exoDNAse (exonuclease V) alpha subunit
VSPFTELVKPLFNCLGWSEAQQIDVIKMIETSDLPPNDMHILEGDPFTLLRNIGTRSGFIKGRRCRAMQMKNRTVVFQFKNGETMALTKTRMGKTPNKMKFMGRQLLLRPIFAGTVYKSQGMTLQRAVIDCRMKF